MSHIGEFDLSKLGYALTQIAQDNGVSEAEVCADIEEAIMAGYNNADPAVQAMWASSPFATKPPTTEEFMVWLAGMAAEEQ